ncbi:hypothetical protein [Nonomuraea indica]|uniref:DUF4878 domain-containing protein n=1 Tax=Nonomuraea indica TaxID=1581193 RepID=A0ABW7ZVV6_9ACTN
MLMSAGQARWMIVLVLGLLVACSSRTAPLGGAESSRMVVNLYIEALNTRDASALAKLIPPRNDAKSEIKMRMAKFGGTNIRLQDVVFEEDYGPIDPLAHLKGVSDQGKYSETIRLTQVDARWYLGLGRGTPIIPSGQTPADINRSS